MTEEQAPIVATTQPFVIEPMSPLTEDAEPVGGQPDRIIVFRDSAGEWRWHRVAPDGRLIAGSGQGYVDRADCQNTAVRVNRNPYILELREPDAETDTSGAEAGS